MSERWQVRRALLGVAAKRDIVPLAEALAAIGVQLVATGGTARVLGEAGVPVLAVGDYTGFPEILGGRVKTLHPKIHAGILARRHDPATGDGATLAEHGIDGIDLVVVNLYPFEQAVAAGADFEAVIEQIDIGGPTLVRAAAKNFGSVAVATATEDYPELLAGIENGRLSLSRAQRFELARRAFARIAAYDAAIANYFAVRGNDGEGEDADFGRTLTLHYRHGLAMRYGENPHQRGALYLDEAASGGIGHAEQVQGRALSYNNVADADAALAIAYVFGEPACAIVKHANPAGVAVADDLAEAYRRALAADPTSAFGGIIAVNRALDDPTASAILESGQFVEVIVVPALAEAAAARLRRRRNLRVLVCEPPGAPGAVIKQVSGGLLVQDPDTVDVARSALRVVTRRTPGDDEMGDLLFAWRVAKFARSNAIVYASGGRTVGIGAGQVSRVMSARIAAIKAKEEGLPVAGAVMASDALFPFRDSIDAAAGVGIRAVIQPGGSIRDDEVIAAADEHDMAMVFTGLRHFRH